MKMYRCDGFVRVSKKRAKKLYDEGQIIYLCPYRLRPGYPWHPEIAVTKTDLTELKEDFGVQYFVSNTRDFETLVNDFAYYNCTWKNGEYPAYYIKG